MTQWTDEIKAILKGEKRLSKSYSSLLSSIVVNVSLDEL